MYLEGQGREEEGRGRGGGRGGRERGRGRGRGGGGGGEGALEVAANVRLCSPNVRRVTGDRRDERKQRQRSTCRYCIKAQFCNTP